MPSKLEQLKRMTTVVADTGDISAIERYQPEDATTNPSLLLKAAELEQYQPLLHRSLEHAEGSGQRRLSDAASRLAVLIGREILTMIPGRVSTEVDARLSFDTSATINQARRIIHLYSDAGVERDRILIKIAATWEGIRAAEVLEREGIQCNLTLLFSDAQAIACAEAGVTLISPFVGRILDWYKAQPDAPDYSAETDPGVRSVKDIYDYYKRHGYQTIVMGASFRNTGEIEALAGCDRLTISPTLLEDLSEDDGELPRQLEPTNAAAQQPPAPMGVANFRWRLNDNAMATEKLAQGIRAFAADQIKLEQLLEKI